MATAEITLRSSCTAPQRGWTCEAVSRQLDAILQAGGDRAERSTLGCSVEGRPIEAIRIGGGPRHAKRRVIAWSQMHGNEQTYTTVALNLLRLLLEDQPIDGQPTEAARAILDGCQLLLIPMLNPDGAERNWRFNAQGVDINRDARRPATPEGRVLRDAVLEFQPEFGFNLHNQSHRRWLLGAKGPVALSLLAPPVDDQNTQSPSTIAARRVAACIARTALARRQKRVTRYSADYMPRAFGEWVQSQGVSTVLLEAGGWLMDDVGELERLNLEALVTGLAAIGSGEFENSDTDAYDSLPRAEELESFDMMIRRASIIHGKPPLANTLDVGMNRGSVVATPPNPGRAAIADIGDLSDHPGVALLQAGGMTCLPGRIELVNGSEELTKSLDADRLESALREGTTTLLVAIDQVELDDAEALTNGDRPLINVGFLLRSGGDSHAAAHRAVLGTIDAGYPQPGPVQTAAQWLASNERAGPWLPERAAGITRGAPGDLVLTDRVEDAEEPVGDIRAVLIGGTVVWAEGRIVERRAGAWLRRKTVVDGA